MLPEALQLNILFSPHHFRFCPRLQLNISAFTYKNKNHSQSAQTCVSLMKVQGFVLFFKSFCKLWVKDRRGALNNPKIQPLSSPPCSLSLARSWAPFYGNEINPSWQLFLEARITFEKGIFLQSVSGAYTHLHPLSFATYMTAIPLVLRKINGIPYCHFWLWEKYDFC